MARRSYGVKFAAPCDAEAPGARFRPEPWGKFVLAMPIKRVPLDCCQQRKWLACAVSDAGPPAPFGGPGPLRRPRPPSAAPGRLAEGQTPAPGHNPLNPLATLGLDRYADPEHRCMLRLPSLWGILLFLLLFM